MLYTQCYTLHEISPPCTVVRTSKRYEMSLPIPFSWQRNKLSWQNAPYDTVLKYNIHIESESYENGWKC